MGNPRALLLDDDASSCQAMAEWFGRLGFTTHAVGSLADARAALEQDRFDLAVLDLELPDGHGLELLEPLENAIDTEVIFVTGHASVDSAVSAFRRGAVDYLTKPADMRRLRKIAVDVVKRCELRTEVESLRSELRKLGRFGDMLGASPAMQEIYDHVLKVAPTEATVLISGETGTGKELVAQTVHGLSPRAKRPFLAVNCGAIPENLIESQLFGHERGAFTGADRRHKGVFERANGGTLFLDEITEMPIALQPKLLRVLETGQVTRVGSETPIAVDVRVLAATNRDPKAAVEAGKLREDLLYRLLVFAIDLPPLRSRGRDLDLLADVFLERLNQNAETAKTLTEAARKRLHEHGWPGNVRELKNALEGAFIRAGAAIEADDLGLDPVAAPAETDPDSLVVKVGTPIDEAERRLLLATLERFGGDKRRTAETLGVSLKTIYNRLNAYEQESDGENR